VSSARTLAARLTSRRRRGTQKPDFGLMFRTPMLDDGGHGSKVISSFVHPPNTPCAYIMSHLLAALRRGGRSRVPPGQVLFWIASPRLATDEVNGGRFANT